MLKCKKVKASPILQINGKNYRLEPGETNGSKIKIMVDGKPVTVQVLSEHVKPVQGIVARIGNRIFNVETIEGGMEDDQVVVINRKQYNVRILDSIVTEGRDDKSEEKGPFLLASPMSGRITSVKKQAGDPVKPEESIMVLEAMKMENDIASPKKGIVKEIYVQAGNLVKAGDKLAVIE